ncbi:MAG: DUF362 domain-containing protein [Candidatus Tectomicrobia bacterium]|uniref:DUF362 domain-containing protein n=1 Tax=Tectimicrobiota bacterium TaxID=2528274 RepID=A0A932CN79_UNCTE|nr:DUF362 domain-containing protein [Candidatus Tectomicrobia bacterium]
MNRREFLQWAGATGLGLAWGEGAEAAPAPTAGFPDLAIAKGRSPEAITRAAVEALGGMGRFISRGDIVVVKPNIGWDRVPEQAANTNPDVVRTLVEMAYNAGARQVKVFDNTCNDPRRCYVRSGIQKAVEAVEGRVSFMDPRKFKEVTIPGQVLKRWPLYTEILEADKIINVPIAKHHSLTRLTLAMKNWFGAIGGSRDRLHQQADQAIADLALVFKPALTVLDAYRVLVANGPQGGNLADVRSSQTVVVGIDQVAVDAYGATLFGLKGSDLGYLLKATERSLGQWDLSKLKLKKVEL